MYTLILLYLCITRIQTQSVYLIVSNTTESGMKQYPISNLGGSGSSFLPNLSNEYYIRDFIFLDEDDGDDLDGYVFVAVIDEFNARVVMTDETGTEIRDLFSSTVNTNTFNPQEMYFLDNVLYFRHEGTTNNILTLQVNTSNKTLWPYEYTDLTSHAINAKGLHYNENRNTFFVAFNNYLAEYDLSMNLLQKTKTLSGQPFQEVVSIDVSRVITIMTQTYPKPNFFSVFNFNDGMKRRNYISEERCSKFFIYEDEYICYAEEYGDGTFYVLNKDFEVTKTIQTSSRVQMMKLVVSNGGKYQNCDTTGKCPDITYSKIGTASNDIDPGLRLIGRYENNWIKFNEDMDVVSPLFSYPTKDLDIAHVNDIAPMSMGLFAVCYDSRVYAGGQKWLSFFDRYGIEVYEFISTNSSDLFSCTNLIPDRGDENILYSFSGQNSFGTRAVYTIDIREPDVVQKIEKLDSSSECYALTNHIGRPEYDYRLKTWIVPCRNSIYEFTNITQPPTQKYEFPSITPLNPFFDYENNLIYFNMIHGSNYFISVIERGENDFNKYNFLLGSVEKRCEISFFDRSGNLYCNSANDKGLYSLNPNFVQDGFIDHTYGMISKLHLMQENDGGFYFCEYDGKCPVGTHNSGDQTLVPDVINEELIVTFLTSLGVSYLDSEYINEEQSLFSHILSNRVVHDLIDVDDRREFYVCYSEGTINRLSVFDYNGIENKVLLSGPVATFTCRTIFKKDELLYLHDQINGYTFQYNSTDKTKISKVNTGNCATGLNRMKYDKVNDFFFISCLGYVEVYNNIMDDPIYSFSYPYQTFKEMIPFPNKDGSTDLYSVYKHSNMDFLVNIEFNKESNDRRHFRKNFPMGDNSNCLKMFVNYTGGINCYQTTGTKGIYGIKSDFTMALIKQMTSTYTVYEIKTMAMKDGKYYICEDYGECNYYEDEFSFEIDKDYSYYDDGTIVIGIQNMQIPNQENIYKFEFFEDYKNWNIDNEERTMTYIYFPTTYRLYDLSSRKGRTILCATYVYGAKNLNALVEVDIWGIITDVFVLTASVDTFSCNYLLVDDENEDIIHTHSSGKIFKVEIGKDEVNVTKRYYSLTPFGGLSDTPLVRYFKNGKEYFGGVNNQNTHGYIYEYFYDVDPTNSTFYNETQTREKYYSQSFGNDLFMVNDELMMTMSDDGSNVFVTSYNVLTKQRTNYITPECTHLMSTPFGQFLCYVQSERRFYVLDLNLEILKSLSVDYSVRIMKYFYRINDQLFLCTQSGRCKTTKKGDGYGTSNSTMDNEFQEFTLKNSNGVKFFALNEYGKLYKFDSDLGDGEEINEFQLREEKILDFSVDKTGNLLVSKERSTQTTTTRGLYFINEFGSTTKTLVEEDVSTTFNVEKIMHLEGDIVYSYVPSERRIYRVNIADNSTDEVEFRSLDNNPCSSEESVMCFDEHSQIYALLCENFISFYTYEEIWGNFSLQLNDIKVQYYPGQKFTDAGIKNKTVYTLYNSLENEGYDETFLSLITGAEDDEDFVRTNYLIEDKCTYLRFHPNGESLICYSEDDFRWNFYDPETFSYQDKSIRASLQYTPTMIFKQFKFVSQIVKNDVSKYVLCEFDGECTVVTDDDDDEIDSSTSQITAQIVGVTLGVIFTTVLLCVIISVIIVSVLSFTKIFEKKNSDEEELNVA